MASDREGRTFQGEIIKSGAEFMRLNTKDKIVTFTQCVFLLCELLNSEVLHVFCIFW